MRLLQIALTALILSGCGASRRAMKSDTETIRETTASVRTETDTTATERTTTLAGLSKDEEIIIEMTEFDTALPVDSVTGTPPVKRKIRQSRKAAAQARQVTTTDAEAVSSSTVSAEGTEKENTDAHSEEESRRGLNWWQTALCATGVVAMLAGVLWIWMHSVTTIWKGRK